MRVVSLLASGTEIVYALGAGRSLVGRSHECDFPASVARLPILTEPKFATDGSSYQIDQRIRAIVQEGLSVYKVDGSKLEELHPDLVITQTQCEVCAVSERDVESALHEFMSDPPQIVSLRPDCLADVWNDIERVASALDRAQDGVCLVASMKHRMNAIAKVAKQLPGKPTVACIEWIDPLMAAGNWMPELVEMAGGVNLFGEAGKHSPSMSWDDLVKADPDVLFVSPCGCDLPTTRNHMRELSSRPAWITLQAVRNHRVILADGNQFLHRPGPRLVESLEILAQALHPEAFSRSTQGVAWDRYLE